MTLEIGLILLILAVALVLFVTEVVRMDLVALLVLGSLAVTGLVSPSEAVSGFSNPAVVTVWAMFILSEGLTRSGIAKLLGSKVMAVAGREEATLIVAIMLTSGSLSFFMNNIGVAALMLPVVMDICRRTGVAPGRLLMPMAFGTLMGGLTTLFGTPANLLVSQSLSERGYEAFGLFDYVPVGAGAWFAGTLFIAFFGRFLLPATAPDTVRPASQRKLRAQFGLQEKNFTLLIPAGSPLVERSLAESRLSSAVGLVVVALERGDRVETLPPRTLRLAEGDKLLVQGKLDRYHDLLCWSDLVIEREAPVLMDLISERTRLVEATVAEGSRLVRQPPDLAGFRRMGVHLLAIRRQTRVRRDRLFTVPLRAGDRLLLQGAPESLDALESSAEFSSWVEASPSDLEEVYRLDERLFVVRVPRESRLDGLTLGGSRLDQAFDFHVLARFRAGELEIMPAMDEPIAGGDLLLFKGRPEDLDVLRGLQGIEIDERVSQGLNVFDEDRLATLEAVLAPRSPLAGQGVGEIDFRGRYGLELGAIWRSGEVIREQLDREILRLGDALFLIGPRQKLALLNEAPELLVLTPVTASFIDTTKAPLAAGIVASVVISVLAGWAPISIAAIMGVVAMVLTRCLSMEQAYEAIDWRAVFLIAGMLPLGIAIETTGTAEYLARMAMDALGGFGPWPVIVGLYIVTAIGTMIIPTAALVVLMSPIVISASLELGVAPQTAMMAIAMAASASFTSPISHPANILIMGPGGYRFADYLRLGGALTLVVFLVVMVLLPIFWPLQPV